MAFFTQTRPVADSLTDGFHGLSLGGFAATLKTWNDRRITRHALHALSDRELYDVGLTRAQIDTVARR